MKSERKCGKLLLVLLSPSTLNNFFFLRRKFNPPRADFWAEDKRKSLFSLLFIISCWISFHLVASENQFRVLQKAINFVLKTSRVDFQHGALNVGFRPQNIRKIFIFPREFSDWWKTVIHRWFSWAVQNCFDSGICTTTEKSINDSWKSSRKSVKKLSTRIGSLMVPKIWYLWHSTQSLWLEKPTGFTVKSLNALRTHSRLRLQKD